MSVGRGGGGHFIPTLLTPTVLPSNRIKRPRWRPVELNDLTKKKTGDCEQFTLLLSKGDLIKWLIYLLGN